MVLNVFIKWLMTAHGKTIQYAKENSDRHMRLSTNFELLNSDDYRVRATDPVLFYVANDFDFTRIQVQVFNEVSPIGMYLHKARIFG